MSGRVFLILFCQFNTTLLNILLNPNTIEMSQKLTWMPVTFASDLEWTDAVKIINSAYSRIWYFFYSHISASVWAKSHIARNQCWRNQANSRKILTAMHWQTFTHALMKAEVEIWTLPGSAESLHTSPDCPAQEAVPLYSYRDSCLSRNL